MPTATGKYLLNDFVADLQRRGFDSLQPLELQAIVNRAYFAVAKKSRWEWERVKTTLTLDPGEFAWSTQEGSADLPNFRSLDRLYMTTAGYERKLDVMNESAFFHNYLNLDLTQEKYRNEPTSYFIYGDQLYIISPPVQARTFVLYYYQRPTWLNTDLDIPVTPQHLDEAIIDAARVRAHTRVNEPALSQLARVDLDEHFDDMRDDEEEDMHELAERTTPDSSWL
jgi:hypothetical protein